MSVYSSEKENDSKSDHRPMAFIDEKLFKSRCLTIFGEINDKLARTITERLLALASDSDDPISLYISSPGGHVESGDVIYDIIKFIKPPVRVIGTGWVASAATTIYLAAEKDKRFALPNTRFLIHQPLGGFQGQASDFEIHAKEILSMKKKLNEILAFHTGKEVDQLEKDTERDNFMNCEEAKDYGLIYKVIS